MRLFQDIKQITIDIILDNNIHNTTPDLQKGVFQRIAYESTMNDKRNV